MAILPEVASSTADQLHESPTADELNHKQAWEKYKRPRRHCPFCDLVTEKLSRHILRRHKDIPDVQKCKSLPPKDRKIAMDKFRKMGTFEFNLQFVNEGKFNDAISERKTTKKKKMCGICRGFYSTNTIWKHKQTCVATNGLEIAPEHSTVNLETLGTIPAIEQSPDGKQFNEEVLSRVRLLDNVSTASREDALIIETVIRIWKKKGKRDHEIALSSLRLLGKFRKFLMVT